MNSILLRLVFGTYSYILHFVILSIFYKFPTPSQNVEFPIHRSHIEIGLSEGIKFCTKKIIKITQNFPPKM